MNITIFTNLIRKNYSIFIILFLFLTVNNFFYNFYVVYVRDYDERVIRSYGFCKGVSYGYIKEIKNKYLLKKKVTIINFELNPPSIGLFHDLKKDESNEELILLNNKTKNKDILMSKNIDLKNYNLINSFDNCMYYKKK
tara:strand:+ start:258 stop:674 length:417 start_codon:yes stop_codon:yes gene_type:complete